MTAVRTLRKRGSVTFFFLAFLLLLLCSCGIFLSFFLFFSDLTQEKLRVTHDERTANEIMEVLGSVRMRAASEGKGDSPEISESGGAETLPRAWRISISAVQYTYIPLHINT